MLFSVVIAVRNESSVIEKCINAVFNQDFKHDYEVVIVDGMSNDGTYEILEKLHKNFNFILLKNPKLNAAAGRNIGIKNSKGSLIAFVDGDAVPSSDWLSKIELIFNKYNDVIGVGGPDLLPKDSTNLAKSIGRIMSSPISHGGRFNPSTQHSLIKEEIYVDHISTCNLCLKRVVFEKIGYFDENFVKGQDLELNYRIIKSGLKLLYSPQIKVIHYRKNRIEDFAKQIFKWAKAKVAIIKKHCFNGLTSYIYLWPFYFIIILILSFAFFYLFGIARIFIILLFFGLIFYCSIIIFESARLSKNFKDKKLLLYGILLFPVIHFSYSFGILYAILKKDLMNR